MTTLDKIFHTSFALMNLFTSVGPLEQDMFFKVIPWKVLYNPKGYKGFSVENVSKILNFPKPRDLYFFIIWKKNQSETCLNVPIFS